jgi:hypothetical protein
VSSSTAYEVRLVTSPFIEERWVEASDLLGAACSWSKLRHVVAVGSDGSLLGGLFCLPLDRPADETRCGVGQFFTAETLSDAESEEIGDAVMERAHQELAEAGYEAVVTGLGTESTARYMSERHRYLPAPVGDQQDRWIKSLRQGPASTNSVKKQWKNEQGQSARYASTDIAKDEIILDLTMLFERASGPSAQTLQMGDGWHYRSSEGPFGLNHACSPNGYLRFDDLTYRALRDISQGEELSFHYCTTEFEMASPFDCLCGSPDCLGRVGGFTHMNESQVEKLLPLLSPFLKSKL